jgi:pilus assembly protein Flp/PilA
MAKNLNRLLRGFLRDDSGATAIEYGLIVALVFLAVITSVNTFADNTNEMYSEIVSALN